MSAYIYKMGSRALMKYGRWGAAPMGVQAADDRTLGDVTIIPGGPEPIAGVVDDVTSFVQQHPIEAALAVAAGWYYGPKIVRSLLGRRSTR